MNLSGFGPLLAKSARRPRVRFDRLLPRDSTPAVSRAQVAEVRRGGYFIPAVIEIPFKDEAVDEDARFFEASVLNWRSNGDVWNQQYFVSLYQQAWLWPLTTPIKECLLTKRKMPKAFMFKFCARFPRNLKHLHFKHDSALLIEPDLLDDDRKQSGVFLSADPFLIENCVTPELWLKEYKQPRGIEALKIIGEQLTALAIKLLKHAAIAGLCCLEKPNMNSNAYVSVHSTDSSTEATRKSTVTTLQFSLCSSEELDSICRPYISSQRSPVQSLHVLLTSETGELLHALLLREKFRNYNPKVELALAL